MAKIWSIMIWLYPANHMGEREEQQREEPHRPRGWRVGVFNPPALERIAYGHYDNPQTAEAALKELADRIAQGQPLWVKRKQDEVFLIPAHSVQYAAMGEGQTATNEMG